jgi:preprotein translocase SecF subunit
MRWPLIRILPEKTDFHFVGFARLAGFLSIIAVIGSLALCFTQGLNLGIDFKGGTVMEIATDPRPVDLGKVRGTLAGLNLGDVQVQAFGKPSSALVRFQTPPGQDAPQTATRVQAALQGALGQVRFSGIQVVGPKVSGELFRNGVLALGVAIGLMLIYIWFRFELQFGFGAVAALFHDVILTFGLFALFRLEFTLTIIAAILTIIGYSMNDTVVVFDRLRENLRKYRRTPLRDVIELSINETLSRTVITGVTALLALGGLAVFGGEALRNFSIALIFGIIIGTYSSIYVASPIILLWGVKRGDDAEPSAAQAAKAKAAAARP